MPKFYYVVETEDAASRLSSAADAATVMNQIVGQNLFTRDMVQDYFIRKPKRGRINQFRTQFTLTREYPVREVSLPSVENTAPSQSEASVEENADTMKAVEDRKQPEEPSSLEESETDQLLEGLEDKLTEASQDPNIHFRTWCPA